MALPTNLFTSVLPSLYRELGVSYPSAGLSSEVLEAFLLQVNYLWGDRLRSFQTAQAQLSKARLELERSGGKMKPQAAQAAAERLIELQEEREVAYQAMLQARRAEELARVLPQVYSGDQRLTRWLEVQLTRVAAYSPELSRHLTDAALHG